MDIPDGLARIVLFLDQDGEDLIPSDSPSVASGDGVDGWVHLAWSLPSSQMAIDGVWTSARSRLISAGIYLSDSVLT